MIWLLVPLGIIVFVVVCALLAAREHVGGGR